MTEISVAFFFPDRNLGGGPFYLMRLASFLSKCPGYRVFYIDYADGFSHQIDEIDKTKITFIDYTDYSDKLLINFPCILFAPIYYLHNMPMVHKDSKVLFFNWHNLCLPVLKNNLGISDKGLHQFLKLVYKHNAQVFCDGAHYSANNEIAKLKFSPNFVPIIVDEKKSNFQKLINPLEINVAVLGRLVIDKIQSINNLIFNFEKINTDKIINIHVIGSGPAQGDIHPPKNNNIHLIFCGVLRKEKLDNYLSEKVDILFAMGTSILEGAALGIPSVIVSADLEPYYSDEFVWFYDTKNYCLGWDSYQIRDCSEMHFSLKEIISEIYIENKKEVIGKKCLNFCRQNFSYDFSVNKLKEYLSKTSLSFDDICKCKEKILKTSSPYGIVGFLFRKIRNKLFLNAIKAELVKQGKDLSQSLSISTENLRNTQNDFEAKVSENLRNIQNDFEAKVSENLRNIQNDLEIKFSENLRNTQNDLEAKLSDNLDKSLFFMRLAYSYQIQIYAKVLSLHPPVFLKYKNINKGKKIVIIASGPSVKYYTPIENSLNIAVNGSFAFDKVDYDYYFATDFAAIHESINKIPYANNLKNAKKFYGIFGPVVNEMVIPEQFSVRDNAERYISHSLCYDANAGTYLPYINFPIELSAEPMISHGTIAHEAFEFALYTNPSKIYLVGCDCTSNGHFFNNTENHEIKKNECEVIILGWKKLAEFARCHYPSTEIISINPIGLKSVFKDVYTDSFLQNNPM